MCRLYRSSEQGMFDPFRPSINLLNEAWGMFARLETPEQSRDDVWRGVCQKLVEVSECVSLPVHTRTERKCRKTTQYDMQVQQAVKF